MKTDSFASRHIGISEEDIQVMLRKIGVATLDELIDGTIPLPLPLFKETCLKTRCGILLTLLIKPKFHKGVLKPL